MPKNFLFSPKRDYVLAKQTEPAFYVYIIECRDGSYYTGFSKDICTRVAEHHTGNGATYTKEKGVKGLVYYETWLSEQEARKREKYIKKAGRIYRKQLVTGFQKIRLLTHIP